VKVYDSKGNIYECDGVIVTVPVAVLKTGMIEFVPQLCKEKRDAIESMNVGSSSKLFLKFKESFWPDDMVELSLKGPVNYFWAPGLKGGVKKNNVLTALISAQNSIDFRNKTLEEITQIALDSLSRVFGEAPKKLFEKAHYQDWYKEPFAKGGYYFALSSDNRERIAMTTPENGKIMFSGDQCDECHSTIHAAMASGRRAARYYIQKFDVPMQFARIKPKL